VAAADPNMDVDAMNDEDLRKLGQKEEFGGRNDQERKKIGCL
jgi:hypothetical protein